MRYWSGLFMAALICGPTIAMAQAPKEAAKVAAPSVPAIPERTTASFGDWVVRCEGGGERVKRVCEAVQMITVQGQANPIAQIAIGKPLPSAGQQITLVLPTNVALAGKPQLAVAKTGSVPLDMTWQRCAPGGCFASAPIADSPLAALSAETEPGRILFKDAADRDVVLPLSFRGLSQALAALAKDP